MRRKLMYLGLMLLAAGATSADETVQDAAYPDTATQEEQPENALPEQAEDGPRTMSGMSILGNEEAPKALVIVPWKGSELGVDLSLSDTLDDSARPVDREVFLRELSYYELRSGNDNGH